jgi:asparagine synthase (glutamine-hydrolysing)
MCGITAFFSSDKRISVERLKRATHSLHHRGPDSQGAWLSPNQRVGLGHARRSIIDLTTGDQPIANEDERIHIVVNGEFYDFEHQRRELERRGHLFRTRSDSEIALHLYEEFGAHCVQQLRGEFAFVLWDEANQTLFAARDRFGIKPLYYAIHDHTLYLASEIKALFAAGLPARWDHECFYQGATGPPMSDRTLFDGVHQVPPGHYLTATTNGMRILRYWEFYYPPADELGAGTRDESAFVEEFAAVFEEAVRLRMRADVPVGCYLSGGLDSCAVLGFAARLSSSPIQAFTLTFDRAAYDEGDIAREMAARAGANFHPIPIKQSDIADNFAMQSGIRKRCAATATAFRSICSAGRFVTPATKSFIPAKAQMKSSAATSIFASTCFSIARRARMPRKSSGWCNNSKPPTVSRAGCSYPSAKPDRWRASSGCSALCPAA